VMCAALLGTVAEAGAAGTSEVAAGRAEKAAYSGWARWPRPHIVRRPLAAG